MNNSGFHILVGFLIAFSIGGVVGALLSPEIERQLNEKYGCCRTSELCKLYKDNAFDHQDLLDD